MKDPRLHHLFKIDGVDFYRVDGAYIREELEQDFTNWGHSVRFPKLIPADEIWIDIENADSELPFFVTRSLVEQSLVRGGMSYDAAFEIGAAREKTERIKSSLEHGKFKPEVPNEVKLEKIGRTRNGIDVWIVDGSLIRTHFYVDFTEGGHDLVYDFVPDREIWLDDDLIEDERRYVFWHEAIERALMEKKGWTYDQSHLAALRLEQKAREKEDAGDRSFQSVAVFRNAVYRNRPIIHTALTPEQREMKKDYLLNQRMESGNEWPTVAGLMQAMGWINFPEFSASLRESYNEVFSWLNDSIHGKTCWRAVALPESVDPLTHSSLGIMWSLIQSKAKVYSRPYNRTYYRGKPIPRVDYRYKARIDIGFVDKFASMLANIRYLNKEHEIRFFKDAPIFVLGVEIGGRLTPINAWRRC